MMQLIIYLVSLLTNHLEKIINSISKLFVLFLFTILSSQAQTVFHTQDITNFYDAFDKVHASNDQKMQLEIVQKSYIDKGSLAVKYVLEKSDGNFKATAKDYLEMMINAKSKLERIRPYFGNLENQKKILEKKFVYFKELYPNFKNGNVYFTIGLDIFGGRPVNNDLIIGCEVMAKNTDDWAVSMVLHEYVHTQQKLTSNALLAQSITEGAADFIAELVNKKSLRETYPNGYIDFGYKNETKIWNEFKKVVQSDEKGNYFDWLYGQKGISINETQMKDLGYFMGYTFCKSHYDNASDKKKAIQDIIELDLSTDENAKQFLLKSGYVPKADLEFIKNLKFTKIITEKKKIEMKVFGYKIENETITFLYDLPKSYDLSELKYITVAGSFNGWNPQDLNYKMNLTKDNRYEFVLPKSKLDKKQYEFKFVINGVDWQPVPETASNFENGNLTLKLN